MEFISCDVNDSEQPGRVLFQRRVTYAQLDELHDFLNANKEIALGYNKSLQAREFSRRFWQEVAISLNSHGDGATKDGKGWNKYWIDYKAKLKKLAANQRASRVRTGGGPPDIKPLNELEKKFLAILGENFGSGLPGIRVEPFPQGGPSRSFSQASTSQSELASQGGLSRLSSQTDLIVRPSQANLPEPPSQADGPSRSFSQATTSQSGLGSQGDLSRLSSQTDLLVWPNQANLPRPPSQAYGPSRSFSQTTTSPLRSGSQGGLSRQSSQTDLLVWSSQDNLSGPLSQVDPLRPPSLNELSVPPSQANLAGPPNQSELSGPPSQYDQSQPSIQALPLSPATQDDIIDEPTSSSRHRRRRRQRVAPMTAEASRRALVECSKRSVQAKTESNAILKELVEAVHEIKSILRAR